MTPQLKMVTESNQNHRHRPSIQAKRSALREPHKADIYVLWQWKDELDDNAPRWKKWVFRWVYRPFNQFCRFKLKIPSYGGETAEDGRLWYFDFQGCTEAEWQAVQAAQGPNWGYAGQPLALLPDESTVETTDMNYPLADAKTQQKYQNGNRSTISIPKIDLIKLAAKTAATDGVVQRYQHS